MRRWAVVDLETTGGRPGPDRVTEVGVVLLDGLTEVGHFQQLIHPGRPIPPFVAELTGITDAMVAEAPEFFQIAQELRDLLADRIFVAHNAPFDHKFLRYEFALCGISYEPCRLCTVQTGRRLFPGHKSYSLAVFSEALGLASFRHHRALGDAYACAGILQKALENHGEDKVSEGIRGEIPSAISLPGWPRSRLETIPDAPGVLSFFGAQDRLLYVTAASSLRVVALNILSMGRKSPVWAARQGIADLTYEVTGSELLARILTLKAVSVDQPACNRKMRPVVSTGAPLGTLFLVGPGRSLEEHCVIAVKQNKVWGYRFVDSFESVESGMEWEGFELLGSDFDSTFLIRQQIQRGGVWRVVPFF